MASNHPTPAPELPSGRWEGREAFSEHVRQAFAHAAGEGWRLIVLSDPDFADWPLGEQVVVDALNDWARSGRELRFLARDFKALRERAPRLLRWRINWDHVVQARACAGAAADGLPSAIWTPSWTLERLDRLHSSGVATSEARRRTELRERLDACWQRGSPAFPVSTLGL
jgi:hypothetical protein